MTAKNQSKGVSLATMLKSVVTSQSNLNPKKMAVILENNDKKIVTIQIKSVEGQKKTYEVPITESEKGLDFLFKYVRKVKKEMLKEGQTDWMQIIFLIDFELETSTSVVYNPNKELIFQTSL